jgi:hypothetical protein
MGIDYTKLSEEFGLDKDEIEERITDDGKNIFTLGWDGDRPGGSGANYITEWNGYYFFTSSDMDSEGPFKSLEEALALEYFHTNETPNPELYSDILPFEKLEEIARDIDEERQEIFIINDEGYEWDGDALRKKKN